MDKLSYSGLKQFDKSPNHFLQYKQRDFKPTPAMEFGTLVDDLLFGGEQYLVIDGDRRCKAWKDAEGKKCLKSDFDQALAIVNRIKEQAGDYIQGDYQAHLEKEYRGVILHGYLDVLGSDFVTDVKTAKDGCPDKFMRSAYDFGYHIQAGVYHILSGHWDYYFVVAETDSPWNVQVYKASEEFILAGVSKVNDIIDRYLMWDETPQGYANGVITLDLPKWAK